MSFPIGWFDVLEKRGMIASEVDLATPPLDCDEATLQAAVVKLAESLGWRVYHTRDSRGSNPGFPDLTLWRDRVLFIELKRQRGRLTPDQEEVVSSLKAAGADVYVIRPENWSMLKTILR